MKIATVLSRLYAWARRLLEPTYKLVYIAELPPEIKKHVLYIINEDGFDEHAVMLCPCGCQKKLYMNLLPDERPCWSLLKHLDGTASLHPSVWRKKDCGSHFWFRKSRVQWCEQY